MPLSWLRNALIKSGYYSKPGFIIVGAQKAGTTALFSILNQHSQLQGALKKEVHFFDREKINPANNYADYHQHFPLPYKVPAGTRLFEATPSYLYCDEAAERIFQYNPKMKIIISLRNPAARALSAWTMYHHYAKDHKKYAQLHDPRSFKEAIESELRKIEDVNWRNDPLSYVKRGIYYPQVKKYSEIFPKKNVLIIEQSELKKNHDATIKTITNFLGVKQEKLPQLEVLKSEQNNTSNYPQELALLNEFYKPHNAQLYELTGTNYNW